MSEGEEEEVEMEDGDQSSEESDDEIEFSVSRVCPERHRRCCQPTSSSACSSAESSDTECSPSPQTYRKRVSFVEDSKLAEIHHMVAWNYAYKSCRKGPWEQYARDRMHFRRRIDSVAGVIEPCLQKKLQHISSQS